MAEIKSTLDIIMEKTKDMTLSAEEKESIRRDELTGKVRGWLRKYRGNTMTLNTLRSEIQKEGEDRITELKELLTEEILQNLEPEGDNAALFELLEEVVGVRTGPLIKQINTFRERSDAKKRAALEQGMKRLQAREISGTAVVPSLDGDEEWNAAHEKLKARFKETIQLIQDN